MNPYEILGVPPNATPDQIKAAFKAKAKTAHPDAGGSDQAFQELNEAHAILSDPERRQRFDETGDTRPPSLDDPDAWAWAIVAKLLESVIGGPDDHTDDNIIEGMMAGVDVAIVTLEQAAAGARESLRRVEKMQARFKRKHGNAGPDMLAGMLKHRHGMATQILQQREHELQMNHRAKELIGQYGYDAPKPLDPWQTRSRMQQQAASSTAFFNF